LLIIEHTFAKPPKIKTKIGTPLIKVIDKVNLMENVYEERPEEEDPIYRWLLVGKKQTDLQIEMYDEVSKGNWGNPDFKAGETVLRKLLEIGKMKVFILPVYD